MNNINQQNDNQITAQVTNSGAGDTMSNPPNIHEIETSYGFLSNLNVYLLIFAGLIAIAIAVVALLSNREGNKLKEAQKAEILRKDDELTIALKNKDIQIEAAKAVAEKAKEGIAVALAQAAQANEKAEGERLARVKLEISLMPRHLTNIQRTQLAELLAREPTGEIAIGCIEITQEALDFGQEIYNTLKNAGWKVQGVNTLLASGLSFSGLLITVKTQNSPSSHLSGVLQRALKEVGIEAPASLDNRLSETQIVLLIGAKS